MPITWTCICGMTFFTEPEFTGQSIVCPTCNSVNIAPGEANALQVKTTVTRNDDHTIIDVDEEIVEVAPLEEEVPEVDVEIEEPDDEELPPARAKKQDYAEKQAAVGSHSWEAIGSVRLVESAYCVALGPAGAWGLAGQGDDILTLNMHTGKKLERFGGHEGAVTSLTISKAGDLAISGDDQGDVLYWEIPRCKRKRRLRVHASPITVTAISNHLNHAASGDRRGMILLWNIENGYEERLASSNWSERITALAFSADSSLLVAGGVDGRVQVWSVADGNCIQKFRLEGHAVSHIQFAVKNETIMASIMPAKLKVPSHPKVFRLDVRSGQAQEFFQPTESPRLFPYRTQLSPGGKRLLCVGRASGGDVLEVWSLITGQRLHAFVDLDAEVRCLASAPENTRLVVGYAKKKLQYFATAQRDTAGTTDLPKPSASETGIRGKLSLD